VTLGQFLIAWANAPFTVVGAATLLFVALSLTGILGFLTGAGHGDHGDHPDSDADGDADSDGDAEGEHDADGDDDPHHGAESQGSSGGHGLGHTLRVGLGFGRIPLSLTWQAFMAIFAVTGLALNAHDIASGPPLVSLAWTLPISTIVAYVGVAALSRLLGPVFTTKEAEATQRSALVGQLGTVISSRVSADFGEIRLNDRTGHVVHVLCKLAPGSRSPLEHEQVVVVDFDQGVLYVAPLEPRVEDDSLKLPGSQAPGPQARAGLRVQVGEDGAGPDPAESLDQRKTAP
jgi:membrane protein implicated in regulation of membrane protease activity